MGLLDSAGGALDAASSILGGPTKGGSAAPPPVTPNFKNGENLGEPPADIGGAQPPNDQTVHDIGAPIEFIHFSYVHPDSSLHYPHPSISDDTQAPKGDGPGSRAIMFRDALEREVILLGGFINSCQRVLKEKEDSEGGVGQALAVVSSLVGGGGGGDSGPKSADLNSIFSSAQQAVTPINISGPLQYKLVHKAGVDLQTARQQYQDFRNKLLEHSDSGGGGGLLSQVSSIAGSLGPVGGIVNTIQGIAFKAFDIYVRVFVKIAVAREKPIEDACHDMTIAAIKGDASPDSATPVFPVWFPKPQVQQAASSSSSDGGALGDVEKKVSDVEQKGEKLAKEVKDFLAGEPVDCPGTPFLAQAFSMSPNKDQSGQPTNDQPPPPPQDPAAPVLAAFHDLKVDLPGFLQTIVKEIMQLNTDFVQAVYEKLMEMEPNATINEKSLFEAGRKRLLQRLVDLLLNQVDFLKRLATGSIGVQGVAVGPGHFLDEGLDLLNQKLASQLDIVLHITMKDLASQLQSVRKDAVSNKSLTMEAYLGVLPYLLAVLFRDTFFPVWDILVKEVFGTIGGPAGTAVNAALDAMNKVKSVVDTARDWKKRAEAMPKVAGDALQRGVGTGDKSGNVKEDSDEFDAAKALQADRGSGSWDDDGEKPPASPPFPITGRQQSGQGQDITLNEWKGLKPDWKYKPPLVFPA